MVAGWEARNDRDSVRVKEVINNYVFGVGKGTLSVIKSSPKKDREEMIELLNHQGPMMLLIYWSGCKNKLNGFILGKRESEEDQCLKNENLGHRF